MLFYKGRVIRGNILNREIINMNKKLNTCKQFVQYRTNQKRKRKRMLKIQIYSPKSFKKKSIYLHSNVYQEIRGDNRCGHPRCVIAKRL